ncbi:response regulator transcription factor [Streptomyces hygroscopicus]|uniref:response regulator transcription factor n=1 Tax=Streptomyces hygroscopicus TaxID=1912 RepID=UPI00223F9EEC|nr:response regulator transcription factor [Streptomyces hygroscopicus]
MGSGMRLADAVPLIRRTRPDILLVEYEQWYTCQEYLRSTLSAWNTRVVMYSRDNTPQSVADSIRGGAAAFVHDSCPPETIVKGLYDVVSGRTFWHLGDDGENPQEPQVRPERARGERRLPKLSNREEQILELLLTRRSNEEIAQELFLTHQTVKNYVSRVFRKVGVSGRKELFQAYGPAGRTGPPAPRGGTWATTESEAI